ncbi:MAG: GNAT family N-acetyltransferase [Treponema sp.]
MKQCSLPLTKSKLRRTKVREAILNILTNHSDTAFSVDELYQQCCGSLHVDLSTIYRTMHTLTEKGVVIKSIHGDSKAYFQLAAHESVPHHHRIVCTQCHAAVEVSVCPLADFEDKISSETGFVITAHSIELTGLCPVCAGTITGAECCIRLAARDDLETVFHLVESVKKKMNEEGNTQWDANYPSNALLTDDIDARSLYVAEYCGVIVGIAVLNNDDSSYGTAVWGTPEPYKILHRLAIAPQYQRKNVASQLLAYIETAAKEAGIKAIRSDTCSANTAMQHLFEKQGYAQGSTIYMRGISQPFYCFEKALL